MNKKMRELLAKIQTAKEEARKALDAKDKVKAKELLTEAKDLQEEFDIEASLYEDGKPDPVEPPKAQSDYKTVFLKAIRGKSLDQSEMSIMDEYRAKLSEKTGEDGGYIVPEDISTAINELKQTTDNLEQYVTIEPVKTLKGSRTLERRADSTPFSKLSEYGTPNAMGELNGPQFDRLSYEIEDYAGFLPVPNDLLADTDQALEAYLRKWLAKKSKATRNYLILQSIATIGKQTFGTYRDIKTALNVDLDPAHAESARIFTNQDGFNYLDQLEDDMGRPLLQPDPKNPTLKMFGGKTVIVLSNKTIPTTGEGLAPMIVGDLKEAIVLWDRQQMSVDMTKEGGNAWRTNTTEFRAIEREDVTLWDSEAVVYGQMDITPAV